MFAKLEIAPGRAMGYTDMLTSRHAYTTDPHRFVARYAGTLAAILLSIALPAPEALAALDCAAAHTLLSCGADTVHGGIAKLDWMSRTPLPRQQHGAAPKDWSSV